MIYFLIKDKATGNSITSALKYTTKDCTKKTVTSKSKAVAIFADYGLPTTSACYLLVEIDSGMCKQSVIAEKTVTYFLEIIR